MVYLLKNYKKNNFRKEIFFFILIILLFVFGFFSFLNKPLSYIVNPLGDLKSNSIELFEDFFSFLNSKKTLVKENKLLKEELFENRLILTNTEILKEENIALKSILGRTEQTSKTILTNVILKPGLSVYNSLVLDVGSNYEIKIGNKVLAGDNIIIGEIEEVYPKTSKVKLYAFPNDRLEVVVGFDKIPAMAEGKGDGIFKIKLPQGTNISEGDVITLPEEDLKILAIVEDIIINPEDPFETILAKSPVNFFKLRWVQIIQE
ncbi:MAG: rod shape-determining protein MreC [Candidatus Pacebacteria bacterium]|nr:rod shape-determining protein MreC [Candidatus Paceibacterota bacterium]